MAHITEKSRYAERLSATGGAWDEHFTVTTLVDKDGVPVEAAQPTYTEIDEEDNSAGGVPVVWAYPAGVYRALNGQELQLSFGATNGGLTVGVANVTVNFYQLYDGAYFLLDTVTIANPAVAAGSMVKVRVKCENADGITIAGATHFTVTGNISVDAACHAYFGYDLFRADMDVELEASDIEIGAVEIKNSTTDQRATVNASGELLVKDTTADGLLATIDSDTSGIVTGIGAVTDAPVSSLETLEDGTARSGISLWKRIINMTIGWWAAYLQRYRANGLDIYHATGTRTGDTTFTFTPDTRVTSVTVDNIIQIIQRVSATGAWVNVPLGTLALSAGPAPYTCTVTGATFGAGDLIKIVMRGATRSHVDATNHDRANEISPLDTRDVALTTNASNVTVGAATVWFPANASAPTAKWSPHTLNAAGG